MHYCGSSKQRNIVIIIIIIIIIGEIWSLFYGKRKWRVTHELTLISQSRTDEHHLNRTVRRKSQGNMPHQIFQVSNSQRFYSGFKQTRLVTKKPLSFSHFVGNSKRI